MIGTIIFHTPKACNDFGGKNYAFGYPGTKGMGFVLQKITILEVRIYISAY